MWRSKSVVTFKGSGTDRFKPYRREKDYMDYQKIAAVGLILISIGYLLTHLPQEEGYQGSVNATFSTDGSELTWANLEVADNETERAEGLMNTTDLGKHEGMLFIFPDQEMRSFWMKNTLIPLDMIFLNEDREVINVETAYPEPNTSDEDLKIYRSERPAKYVIEVNAGFAENYSITEGTKISWRR